MRTSDGIAKITDQRKQARHYFFLRPDLFVSGAPTERTSGDVDEPAPVYLDAASLQPTPIVPVIGRVTVYQRYYVIEEKHDGSTGACSESRHLSFSPWSEPQKHNLRELWIDRQTLLICKATLLWNVAAINHHPFAVDISVVLDKAGLIETFESDGIAHVAGDDVPFQINGSLLPLNALPTVPVDF